MYIFVQNTVMYYGTLSSRRNVKDIAEAVGRRRPCNAIYHVR